MADKGDASHEEVKELTNQFYVTLRAYVARLDKEDESRSSKSFKQIEDLLNAGRATWSDAYQVEQLLVDVFDERTVEIELQSRLLEAESNLRPAVAAQYVKLGAALKTPAERRAMLARLVNDLQWRYTRAPGARRAGVKAGTRSDSACFGASVSECTSLSSPSRHQ